MGPNLNYSPCWKEKLRLQKRFQGSCGPRGRAMWRVNSRVAFWELQGEASGKYQPHQYLDLGLLNLSRIVRKHFLLLNPPQWKVFCSANWCTAHVPQDLRSFGFVLWLAQPSSPWYLFLGAEGRVGPIKQGRLRLPQPFPAHERLVLRGIIQYRKEGRHASVGPRVFKEKDS